MLSYQQAEMSDHVSFLVWSSDFLRGVNRAFVLLEFKVLRQLVGGTTGPGYGLLCF